MFLNKIAYDVFEMEKIKLELKMKFLTFFCINFVILLSGMYWRGGHKNCSGEGCLDLIILTLPIVFGLIYIVIYSSKVVFPNKKGRTFSDDPFWLPLLACIIFGGGYLGMLLYFKY